MTLSPGTRFGAYEITGSLGAGGMGEVYRARDTKLNRDVAIKVLPPAFAQDRERLARFEREAQSLAALNHPHIAQIYGVLESPPALVMEFADGEDLSARIARGAIPISEALPLAIQIADALECAHERGIIHRDLKPANIKITESGSVKVLDFGLAKAMAPDVAAVSQGFAPGELQDSPTFTSPVMTQLGVILGTAAYMAPEQAKGKPADRRADVWAFGGVLFEMLTGRRAFAGEDVTDVIAAIMRAEPDWPALPSGTPIAVRKLLRRCLEKDRGKRLDSIAVARYEIQEALSVPEPSSIAMPPSGARRSLLVPVMVTAVVTALLVGLAAWLARPAVPPPPVVRYVIDLPEGQSLAPAGRVTVALSPDGKTLAYAANRQVYIRPLDSFQATRIFDNDARAALSSITFSPDGGSLAFWLAASIMRMSISGGTPQSIASAGDVNGITWSGDHIVYALVERGSATIQRVRASGGQPETLLKLENDEVPFRPQLLPDGRTLLFTLAKGTGVDRWEYASVVAQAIGDSSRTVIVPQGTDGRYLPSGHLVYAQAGVLFAVPFDPKRLQTTGSAVAVIEGIARGAGLFAGATAHYAVSDAGMLAYVAGPKEANSRVRLEIVLADGNGNAEALKLSPGPYQEPRMSPDARSVAYTVDDGKESSIWIYDTKMGGSPRRLTFGRGDRHPAWSHDGTRLTYQSQREGDLAIFWQRADGSDVPVRLTKPESGSAHIPHAWSKDGDVLLFDDRRGESVSLMMLKRHDNSMSPFAGVVSKTITSPSFSPDGRWVSYSVRQDVNSQNVIFVQPFPATGAFYQISTSGEDGHHSVWSRDSQHLYYTPGPGPLLLSVPVTTTPSFATGELKMLNRNFMNQPPQSPRPFDVAPDRKFVGLGTQQGSASGNGSRLFIVLNWFEELKSRVPLP